MLGFALILCAIPAVVIPVSADDMAKYEKQTYLKPSAGPMESKPQSVTLRSGGTASEDSAWTLTLDGTWKMQSAGRISELAAGNGWGSAYEVEVPGSIYARSDGGRGYRGSVLRQKHGEGESIQRKELVFLPHLCL